MQPKYLVAFSIALFALGAFVFEAFIEEPDFNEPVLKALIEQLEDEGYEVLSVESTLLGRYKLEAHSNEYEREIVIAPGAGTFLRDEISLLNEDYDDDED